VNPSGLDGEDVSDIWLGADRKRNKEIYWEWKYEVMGNEAYNPPQLAVREGDWKLLCDPDGSNVELYNIPGDPAEQTNLATKNPELVKSLKTKLLNWKKTIPEGLDRTALR
jgi:uncharacterized sulfatase